MTLLTPILTREKEIGPAFTEAVATVLTGRYHLLGRIDNRPADRDHCAFLLLVIPRIISFGLDHSSTKGGSLYQLREDADCWLKSRAWSPLVTRQLTQFLMGLVEHIPHEDARYLALLVSNYAPQDRKNYAFNHWAQLDQLHDFLPEIELAPLGVLERNEMLLCRRSFIDDYPLLIDDQIYLPNRKAERYDKVTITSLSRGLMTHPALIKKGPDMFISTISQMADP